MDIFQREKQLRAQFEDNQIQFLLTEIDTGTTFCGVASGTDNPEKTRRNIANAREAYDTILKHVHEVRFDEKSQQEFDTKMSRFKTLLRGLGQQV